MQPDYDVLTEKNVVTLSLFLLISDLSEIW